MTDISLRAQAIKPFIAMEILQKAQALIEKGHSVVSFSLGEPDFPPPPCVLEAMQKALQDGKTKYTHSLGAINLREAIAGHYLKKYKVNVSPDQIIVTQGTSPAFMLVFSALLNEGDEIILPTPYYPCDVNFIEFFGGVPRFFPIKPQDNYQWDIKAVKALLSSRTKGFFVTSPSNPTGTILRPDILEELAQLKPWLISDEIYHGLTYEGARDHALLEFSDRVFTVNGFSKTYAMTGFRLGYVIAPKEFVRGMQKIHQNFAISANSFVQEAGVAALLQADSTVEAMRAQFALRRKVMVEGLKKLGFKVPYEPNGAFYVFVSASHLGENSLKLAEDILEKAHVAITPGIDFGCEGYLRFSYATSIENIEEGLHRLGKYLGG